MEEILPVLFVVLASGCVSNSVRGVETWARDGDTLETPNDTIRLIGVDTPETGEVHPREFGLEDTAAVRNCLSMWAEKASSQASELGEVRVVSYGESGAYGRKLAYVFVDNRSRSFNYFLVRRGYARVYGSLFRKRPEFLAAQKKAKSREIGLWGCG